MREDWRISFYRGKFYAYRRENGQPVRRSLGTTDRSVADRVFASFLANLERQKQPEALTVGSICEAYIKQLQLGSRTQKRQQWILQAIRKVKTPNLLSIAPQDLTKQNCRDYADAMARANRAAGTTLSHLGLIRTALRWAATEKWITRAPYIERPSAPPPRDRWLSEDEAIRLIESAKSLHLRTFIVLALHTAARSEAILDLTWHQVNDRFIDFKRPTAHHRAKGRAVVPMNPVLAQTLQEARQAALTDFVIEWAGLPVKRIKRAFASAAKAAGLDDVTPHTLRHTAATWMVQAGVPLSKVAAYLGHSNTRMVEKVYGHHAPAHLRDGSDAIVTRLANRLGPPGSIEHANPSGTAFPAHKRISALAK